MSNFFYSFVILIISINLSLAIQCDCFCRDKPINKLYPYVKFLFGSFGINYIKIYLDNHVQNVQ